MWINKTHDTFYHVKYLTKALDMVCENGYKEESEVTE